MIPMAVVPPTIANGMKNYREVFCRDAGFEQVSRYVSGLAVEVQTPNFSEQELEYLCMTRQASYTEMEAVEKRLVELLSYQRNRLAYRKRTEIAAEIVRQIESEGQFPKADYAFDNGVLTLDLTKLIESKNKHWVSEIECSRHINWEGQWRRVDEVDEELRAKHPESYRPIKAKGRDGEERQYLVFTKAVRLKKYGRKRLVIVHEKEALSEAPRFLLTDALHWESVRVIETWNYRWPAEVFHEFSKQVTGFDPARGAQGGSGQTPLSLELRSAVIGSTGGL